MYHAKMNRGAIACAISTKKPALRALLRAHDAALGHAAFLLADRRSARLVNAIRVGLGQPGPLTARLRRLLLDLRGLLFLEHDDWQEMGVITLLEPEDPAVAEICLLTDGLDEALRGAGIVPDRDWRAA